MTIDQIKELAGHRTVPPWVMKLVQEAVEIEREACAKVCDEQFEKYGCVADKCAAAIRARNEK